MPQEKETIGAVNPYALAELIAGRKINWQLEKDSRSLVEQILERPYEQLFDPKYNSPLYPGVENVGRDGIEFLPKEDIKARDSSKPSKLEEAVAKIKTLEDLKSQRIFSDMNISELEVTNAELLVNGTLSVQFDLSDKVESRRISSVLIDKNILPFLISQESLGSSQEWTPPSGTSWQDVGRFFSEAAEGNDPIQGSVANCYFIAALSSVAWTFPYLISHRTVPSGVNQPDYLNRVKFYSKGGGKNGDTKEVEVSENLVTRSTGSLVYARSSEQGELWCGVYEKAFAKWITDNETDQPDITATAFGNAVKAVAQLIDGNMKSFSTKDATADEIYSSVRGNSISRKTKIPMVAWTYSSGERSPNNVNYADANLVANHAYSIFGWAYQNGKKYIVLRNPWGRTEPTSNVLTGDWMAYDYSFWRPISLTNNDGIFALDSKLFKAYFAGWGYAEA